MQAILGYWTTTAVGTAVTHGVFDLLEARGPATSEENAARLGLSPAGTRALMDGLTGAGLARVDALRYTNTPEAGELEPPLPRADGSDESRDHAQVEYREWLAAAGFERVTVHPTPTPATLLYAWPAGG